MTTKGQSDLPLPSLSLAGDFNVVPTDFDIYPTKSWGKDALVQPAPRACSQRLLDQGCVDAIRTLHPSEPMFTFRDYKRQRWERDAGLRLDHLLLNPVAAGMLVDAGVDRDVRGEEGASDHAPAWIQLGNVVHQTRRGRRRKSSQ
jgi:exodeoxyribonuclease-3